MKLEQVIYEPSVRVRFTKIEIRVLMELSAMHYDDVCKQAGKCGGFLYGISNGNDTLTYRQLDVLGKICEGASFWECSPRDSDKRKGAIGRKLFGDMLRLMKGIEFARKCAEPLAKSVIGQIRAANSKPYRGPLPYRGELAKINEELNSLPWEPPIHGISR